MKSKPKAKRNILKNIAILSTPSKGRKKDGYSEASAAITKKLEEIKSESKMPAAVNNNLSLFRYEV